MSVGGIIMVDPSFNIKISDIVRNFYKCRQSLPVQGITRINDDAFEMSLSPRVSFKELEPEFTKSLGLKSVVSFLDSKNIRSDVRSKLDILIARLESDVQKKDLLLSVSVRGSVILVDIGKPERPTTFNLKAQSYILMLRIKNKALDG